MEIILMDRNIDDGPDALSKLVSELAPTLELLPGVAIIHDLRDGSVAYISRLGLERLGTTMEEIEALGPNYNERFFNAEEAKSYVPEIIALVERNNPDETYTVYQQVKFANDDSWHWHLTSIRLLSPKGSDVPIATLSIAQHITPEQHNTHKVERLLDELSFIRNNLKTFASLGKSERKVLRLLASGRTSIQIADELHISVHTVDTHRKNIRQKLGAKTQTELDRYAMAFDLV